MDKFFEKLQEEIGQLELIKLTLGNLIGCHPEDMTPYVCERLRVAFKKTSEVQQSVRELSREAADAIIEDARR